MPIKALFLVCYIFDVRVPYFFFLLWWKVDETIDGQTGTLHEIYASFDDNYLRGQETRTLNVNIVAPYFSYIYTYTNKNIMVYSLR